MVYKTGLEQLMDNLDWNDREGIRSVIRDFEAVDERARRARASNRSSAAGFHRQEKSGDEERKLAVVGGNYKIGNATVSVFAIGPKCMDYKKAIRIFKNL